MIERRVGSKEFVVQKEGGMDIEEVEEEKNEKIVKVEIEKEKGVKEEDEKKIEDEMKIEGGEREEGMKMLKII